MLPLSRANVLSRSNDILVDFIKPVIYQRNPRDSIFLLIAFEAYNSIGRKIVGEQARITLKECDFERMNYWLDFHELVPSLLLL